MKKKRNLDRKAKILRNVGRQERIPQGTAISESGTPLLSIAAETRASYADSQATAAGASAGSTSTNTPGYRAQSADTTPEAEQVLMEGLRKMPSWKKAEMVSNISRAALEMSLAGLRLRFPDADEKELSLRLASLRLDRDIMTRVFGWDPDGQGL